MKSNKKTTREASSFQTAGALLLALKDWASVPENFPYGLGALILNFVLYQLELIPRWISVWGLIGAILVIAMGFLRMFRYPAIYLAIPLILNEMVLAVWLIVVGFNSTGITSAIVGVLFITALVSTMLNGYFTKSINDPDYLTAASANENKVLTGVLFELTLTASVVAIPILMFPILSEHSVSLALAYVVARIFEGFFDVVIALSQLMLLTLSREFVKAGIPSSKTARNEME
jgi:hypothetical protein